MPTPPSPKPADPGDEGDAEAPRTLAPGARLRGAPRDGADGDRQVWGGCTCERGLVGMISGDSFASSVTLRLSCTSLHPTIQDSPSVDAAPVPPHHGLDPPDPLRGWVAVGMNVGCFDSGIRTRVWKPLPLDLSDISLPE